MPEHVPPGPGLRVVRAAERHRSTGDGVETLSCFSFGDHYDPTDTGYGRLGVVNEERLAPGAGHDAHRHVDAEILTWVLEGALAHRDSTGHEGVVRPGQVQRLSAGVGVEHAERNASTTAPLRYVQTWLPHAEADEPSYAAVDVAPLLADGGLVPVATGTDRPTPDGGIDLTLAGAHLWVGRPTAGVVALPSAAYVHLHVTAGAVVLAGTTLGPGDTARVDGGGLPVTVSAPAELVVWEMRRPS